MSESNEFKYSVIQFLEIPYKDMVDYVCVPTSWVHARGPYDRKVKVSYPVENPLDTERRVRKSKKKSDDWNTYLSVIKYSTGDYDDAKRYIQRMIPALQNTDKTLSSVVENPRRSTRKINNKSGNTTTLQKRNALQDPDEEPHNKRSRATEPNESDNEVTIPAKQAFEVTNEDPSIPHKVSKKDQRQTETIDKSMYGNSSENIPTTNQNPVEENHYLIPEKVIYDLLCDFFRCIQRDLQTNLQVCTASLVTDAMTKIMNNSNTAWRHDYSIPSLMKTPQEAPTLNEKKINEDCTKQKDTDAEDDDEDQPLKKISSLKRNKNVVLPAEYDEDDSKWTLKYRKPAPGLVELMEHSGVYVRALELTNCKRLSKDCKSMARMLLSEIFNTSALGTCSWTGARAKAFDQDGTHVRPGLDEHARTVLMNYVAEYAKKEGWHYENHTILNSIRNKMQEMRVKYKSKLSESKRISK